MLYFVLIAVTAAMALVRIMGATGQNLRDMAESGVPSPMTQLKRIGVPLLTFMASLAFAGPLLQTIVAGVRMDQGDSMVFDPRDTLAHGSWGIYAMAASIPLLLILTVIAFRRALAAGSNFAGTGTTMVFLGSTIIATMTVVSHFTWYRGANDGWADLQAIREVHPIKDIDCTNPRILIHREAGQQLEYRCPTLVMLVPYSSQPVVPWPSFKDGTSAQLAAAIEEIESKAEQTLRHNNNDAAQ